MFKYFDKFYMLVGIFIATYIFAPMLSAGLDISFFNMPLMPGSLMIMLNVALLGVIQQNYGQEIAKKLVVGGIIARIAIWGLTALTLLLPATSMAVGYKAIVLSGFRILIAGIIARYVTTILIDIPAFQKMKDKYNTFIMSLVTSLLIETIIGRGLFVFLAKYGTQGNLLDRFIAQGTVSIAFIFLLAPLVAGLNYLLFDKPAKPINTN